ncbi:hypothetical protein CUJ83_04010 [Methanocella sp. CWC-04]|uniref:Uncharacterized protein n=1 Tax=Methanooceanicella nereidis TaxID=2052831 RepID=A0AAP2RB99_9EURY|nr:hypothetical protein [Methanocella sp. CWC-04]MCD1294158.1 hypothetical protein [Methanocella sp. CWC-04]
MARSSKVLVISVLALMLSCMCMQACAQKDKLMTDIGQKKYDASIMGQNLQSTDSRLAERQQSVDQGLDKLSVEEKNRIKQDIHNTANYLSGWKKDVARLENDYEKLYQRSNEYQLTPEEQASVNREMSEFKANIEKLKTHLKNIQDKMDHIVKKIGEA